MFNDTQNNNDVKPSDKLFSASSIVSIAPSEEKYIMVVDKETKKIKGCFPIKSKNLGTGWIALYQDMVSNIADAKLSYEEYRVFLKLLSKVDFENYLTVSQKKLSTELNMKQPNIARAIKGLCERQIIIEGPRTGLNKTYRFNPYIAHKGKDRDRTILDFNNSCQKK